MAQRGVKEYLSDVRRGPLFTRHSEILDVDDTFLVLFNGMVESTIHCTGYVLHAHTYLQGHGDRY